MVSVGIRIARLAVSALIIHSARYFHVRESNIISLVRHTLTKWTVIAFRAQYIRRSRYNVKSSVEDF